MHLSVKLQLHSVCQIASLSHGVSRPPPLFHVLHSPLFFPVLAFSPVYTSVVIYLLFCGRNVVSICLALLHWVLICSQLQNHTGIKYTCSFSSTSCTGTGTWAHIRVLLFIHLNISSWVKVNNKRRMDVITAKR